MSAPIEARQSGTPRIDQALAVAREQIGLVQALQANAHAPRDDVVSRTRHRSERLLTKICTGSR